MTTFDATTYVLRDEDGGWYADVGGVMDPPDPLRTREQALELACNRLLAVNAERAAEARVLQSVIQAHSGPRGDGTGAVCPPTGTWAHEGVTGVTVCGHPGCNLARTARAALSEVLLVQHTARHPDVTSRVRCEQAVAVYEATLRDLGRWDSWADAQNGDGAYLLGCHPRCAAIEALEAVDPHLDLRTLGYDGNDDTDDSPLKESAHGHQDLAPAD